MNNYSGMFPIGCAGFLNGQSYNHSGSGNTDAIHNP
jgi:hypothetical protein